MSTRGFTTRIVHSDRSRPIEHGALHKPIHTSIPFGYADSRELARVFQGEQAGFTYARNGQPTATALEEKITGMEEGIATVAFGTGMGAISATILSLLRAGDHLVSSSYLFGNTNSLFNTFEQLGISVTLSTPRRSRTSRRPSRREQEWFSSRPLPTHAHRLPTSRASASCANAVASSISSTTR